VRHSTAIKALVALTATTAATLIALVVPSAAASHGLVQVVDPGAAAGASADAFVASDSSSLRKSPSDRLVRTKVHPGTNGLQYVAYERTYAELPVVGGDLVVVTDSAGKVLNTAVAQDRVINVGTTPKIQAQRAQNTAKGQLVTVEGATAPRLVVLAWGTPRLAWETVVAGASATAPSKLHVFVDALTGKVVDSYDEVRAGTGNGFYNGTVTISTSGSGTSWSMSDPTRPGIRCGGQSGTTFTGTDDNWGNGTGTSLETACVDALYAVQKEWDMLGAWLGRNGINGSGGGFPARVGLNQVNAFWNGSYTNFGRSSDGQRQVTPIDVVAHEYGHAIFQTTPGGAGSGNENGGINEATGDIFGALTEQFANNPNDPPDYLVGEEVNLTGNGPIRNMFNPAALGDPNCWSTAIPNTEVHAAAGPLNHWFYLVARGSNPAGGPASPTCNGSTVTGIGIQDAGRIYYNAMLAKTSTWRYANVRLASLNAAVNLFGANSTQCATVKAAWNAVSVPVQSGEPTCQAPGNNFSISVSPTSRSVAPGGSTTATVSTAVTSGSAQTVSLSASGLPSGANASFSPSSVTAGGSSTMTITTSTSTPPGTYNVTITGTGTSATHSTPFSLTVTGAGGCSSPGQKLGNPGFESGSAPWTASSGVIGSFSGQVPRSGTRYAWLNGYGFTTSNFLRQTVTLPAGCSSYNLSFWLHIDSAETTTTIQFDILRVQIRNTSGTVLATLATYSNLNEAPGYLQKSFNVGAFAGQTIQVNFLGTEDSSLQTSFVVDDTALNVS
jgi:Zn-dependent metalloprotease